MDRTRSWELREFETGDVGAARALWATSEGVGQGPGDSEAGVRRFLARNPGLSFVAVEGGAVVGAVLGSDDGRRGFIYHLAVAPSARRQGIATALARRCLDGLQRAGLERCQVFVFTENMTARAFWEAVGGALRSELCVYSIPLQSPDAPEQ